MSFAKKKTEKDAFSSFFGIVIYLVFNKLIFLFVRMAVVLEANLVEEQMGKL